MERKGREWDGRVEQERRKNKKGGEEIREMFCPPTLKELPPHMNLRHIIGQSKNYFTMFCVFAGFFSFCAHSTCHWIFLRLNIVMCFKCRLQEERLLQMNRFRPTHKYSKYLSWVKIMSSSNAYFSLQQWDKYPRSAERIFLLWIQYVIFFCFFHLFCVLYFCLNAQ